MVPGWVGGAGFTVPCILAWGHTWASLAGKFLAVGLSWERSPSECADKIELLRIQPKGPALQHGDSPKERCSQKSWKPASGPLPTSLFTSSPSLPTLRRPSLRAKASSCASRGLQEVTLSGLPVPGSEVGSGGGGGAWKPRTLVSNQEPTPTPLRTCNPGGEHPAADKQGPPTASYF